MHGDTGPAEVREAAERATALVAGVLTPSAVAGARGDWAEALAGLQRLADATAAAQHVAIARLAAIEPEWAEDGTVLEVHRAPGHVALDAPAIVSGVLSVTAVQAERRVRSAVRLAADGPEGTRTATGLGGLHSAMAAGRLDAHRAGVVADELELAPPEVAATVVAALEPHLDGDDGPALRRRCRRVLARVSPDLLRQRARRARSESRLERWASEPGVDTWHGTFPSEEAARAWAAVDALARRYVDDGTCTHIDRARAKALTDLVEGSATIETVVTVTVPEDAAPTPGPGGRTTDDLVEVSGLRPGEKDVVEGAWLARAVADSAVSRRDRLGRSRVVGCHPATGAPSDVRGRLATDAYRPGVRLAALVRLRDGRCRFPGCHVAARFCDLDHARPWPAGPTTAANLLCLCRRHHRTKQRTGWVLRLDPDGTARWTDPTGRSRTTSPVDALDALVLPARAGEVAVPPPPRSRTILPEGPHSVLEFAHEHGVGGRWERVRCTVDLHRPDPARWSVGDGWAMRHRRRRPPPPDDPPF